jgi:uncharacterized LabA/DUF88 family protein
VTLIVKFNLVANKLKEIILVTQFSRSRVGVYVDVANLYRSGGHRLQYDVLREFCSRDGAELVRLNAYVSYDAERAVDDREYGDSVNSFYAVLRDFGYKVIKKEVRWYTDENGRRMGKANSDLDLAVDMLLQAENLERVVLASGDGDFARVVLALQSRGCRVEIVGLQHVSQLLRNEADLFVSGYLIPNLIPIADQEVEWGIIGSRVRGICYAHKPGYGFLRFMKSVSHNLWATDTRRDDSPYEAVFFHDSSLPTNFNASLLPSRDHIFEFTLVASERGLQAVDMQLIVRL